MFLIPTINYVAVGVERIGGPTKAAHALEVSNTTIHTWIKRQYISNIDKAKKMAELAGLDVQHLRATP